MERPTNGRKHSRATRPSQRRTRQEHIVKPPTAVDPHSSVRLRTRSSRPSPAPVFLPSPGSKNAASQPHGLLAGREGEVARTRRRKPDLRLVRPNGLSRTLFP